MPTNNEIDAAFAVAQMECRWSINKIPLVRRMLEAAEREREGERVAGDEPIPAGFTLRGGEGR